MRHLGNQYVQSTAQILATEMEAVVAVSSKPAIKVAALCGSLRKASFHRGLIRSAAEICRERMEGIEIAYVEIEELPWVNTDLEENATFPAVVKSFRQKISCADSVLFASPEYNYSISAPLKNAIDWASRPPNVWAGKAAAIVSAGGGFGGGIAQYHLREVGVFVDLQFVNKPEFFLKAFQTPHKFDEYGDLIDADAKKKLEEVLLSLQDLTLRLIQPK